MVNPSKYLGTSTFTNLLNIRTQKELSKKEASITNVRGLELLLQPETVQQTFDLSHLKAIHRHLFQDIFSWAGELRSFEMHKDGSIFTPYEEIEKYFGIVADEINSTSLENMSLHEKSIKLARYLGLINQIHPFPEGNGRAQRLFIYHLAKKYGCVLDWGKVHSWEIIQTSINVHRDMDYTGMQRMIKRILICD